MAKKSIKLSYGTVYQKMENGNYYFRYQVNDKRKSVSLRTKNQKDAIKEAESIIPLITASSTEIIAAHVQYAKGWTRKKERLELYRIWELYEKHPDRVRPKTAKIWNTYKAYLNNFLTWLKDNYPDIEYMDEIRDTDEYGEKFNISIVSEYYEYLKTKMIAVDTHNKKITRIAHIFRTLSKYLDTTSPWDNKKLRRSHKEESHITEHRIPLPVDKEQEMFEALKPSSPLKVLNKEEIEVLFYILKFTGQRQKDCANLSWNKINMNRKRLWVTQEKTGIEVSIPIADELYEMLNKAKTWKINDKVLPNTAERYAKKAKDGTNTGSDLINKQLLNVIKYVGLTPSVKVEGRKKKKTVYGVHSFRHGFASFCAETGVPRAVCSSILGADGGIIDSYYVHIGEDAQEKAINGLSKKGNIISDRERIDKTLAIINNLEEKNEILRAIEKILTT